MIKMTREKCESAINDLNEIMDQLDEISNAYELLGNDNMKEKFSKMSEVIDEATDDIVDYVNDQDKLLHPEKEDQTLDDPTSVVGNENVIEQ